MRKMASVTDNTSMERVKIECAGVAAGSKMLVGELAEAKRQDSSSKHAGNSLTVAIRPIKPVRGMGVPQSIFAVSHFSSLVRTQFHSYWIATQNTTYIFEKTTVFSKN